MIRAAAKRRHLARKLHALERYGAACQCCGERDHRFLTFDHSHRDGADHRRALGTTGGAPFLIALEKAGWPDVPGLRTLCANCHMAQDLWGSCPHQEQRLIRHLGIALPLAKAIIDGTAGDAALEAAR